MARVTVIGITVLLLLAGCNAPGAVQSPGTDTGERTDPTPVTGTEVRTQAGSTSTSTNTTSGNEDSLDDPASDTLGWENGLWYNESIDVDRSDGLNESELDAVVSRSMARVEKIRGLEFNETVPVEVISRDEFKNRSANRSTQISDRFRQHQNVKFEALFFVGESRDAVSVRQQYRSNAVLGYYSPRSERIVIVSENASAPKIDEITLSQELFHALQDQHFNLSSERLNGDTYASDTAANAIIEGDGNYVDYLYGEMCDDEWECLMSESSSGGDSDTHVGFAVLGLPEYTEGIEFVRGIKQQGGWDAVNELYQNPPQSTEQFIHPEKYPAEDTEQFNITDKSSEKWRVLELGGDSVNYAEFGETGLYSMFWYAAYQKSAAQGSPETVGVPFASLFVYKEGSSQELAEPNPYNYSHPVTAGFAGDQLLPYVSNETSPNETGYVWKTQWDTQRDAAQFADAYVSLLKYYGAEQVSDDTYVIETGGFSDAYRIQSTEKRVVITNAPTKSSIDEIRTSQTD